MNRRQGHVGVSNLDQPIGFFFTLFGAQPTVTKPDYG